MSLCGTEIKRLWDWFQQVLNAEPDSESVTDEAIEARIAALNEPRFGRLLGIEPRWQSGNVAFYAPEDMVEAGFTEPMAYYHTTDLGVNYTTGLYVAELSCLVKDIRKLRTKEFALLEQYGVEETFEEVQEAFDKIVRGSTLSWKAFGERNGGLKHKSPTVFVLFKLNAVDSISDFTGGDGAIHSYKANWKDQYASLDLGGLLERFVESASESDFENENYWVYRVESRLGRTVNFLKQQKQLFYDVPQDWMVERLSVIASKVLDMNLSRRIVQLEQMFNDLRLDIVQPSKDDQRVCGPPSDEVLLDYLIPVLRSEVLTVTSREELSWLRGLISGTVDSEGMLGDMARIRQRLRDVLGQEDANAEKTDDSYMVFVEWIVENKANIQTLLDTEPPVIEKPQLNGPILLTWNPNKWNGWDYPSFVQRTFNGEQLSDQWTVGKRNISIGTPVILVIQNSSNGVGGVLGLGVTTGDVFDDEHGRLSVPLLWTHLLPIEQHITYTELKVLAPDTYFMTQRSGYVSIKSEQEYNAVVEEFMARFEQVQQKSHGSTILLKPIKSQINAMYRLPDEHFLQEMINCHVDGITVEELIKSIRLRGSYSQAYLETVPGQLNKGFHFFGLDGDVLVENDVSQAYASGDSDPLMVTAFQNFYLFAEVLEWISRHPNQKISTIIEEVNAHYPSWNSPMQATMRVWWLRFFELVSPSVEVNLKGKKLSITNKGLEVLKRIDFTDRELIGSRPKIKKVVEKFTESKFQDILKKIRENSKDQKIVVDKDELKDIHNGFHANSQKRFIILSGLSGTGKTKMLQEYARAYCELQDLEYDAHVFPVAVTPAFRDHTQLLGYLNPLTEPPRYIEGEITTLLREAAETPHLPYFLILDEMNLARVEFYLAPILSAMESDEGVVFHNSDDVDFPQGIKQWPSNIFMAGTVNMDETTHVFSDKVLDRAFTMEFWDIDLATYFEQNPTDAFVQDTIIKVYNALKPAHLHFGYRTVKAIVDYVDRAVETDVNDQKPALDQAIFSKVLPKLKGQKTALLTKILDDMLQVCDVLSRKSGETEKSKTLNKLTQMQARLKDTGLTRFWR